ncbi:polyprotein [Plakobranchus ocellatus]|uniref:Polyprotein n=1 Tax=Plakobranchus ocellatus TaxID=259542 RepID=A0AAV4BFP2_9GAST|nr:polyprotein [Plakobranchus ocellatus]
MKKPEQVFLGSTSRFLLLLWNDTEETDGVYNRDCRWCLPDSDFQDLTLLEDESREEEIKWCGELPFMLPFRQELSRGSGLHKKRKLVIIDSDDGDDGCDTEATVDLS